MCGGWGGVEGGWLKLMGVSVSLGRILETIFLPLVSLLTPKCRVEIPHPFTWVTNLLSVVIYKQCQAKTTKHNPKFGSITLPRATRASLNLIHHKVVSLFKVTWVDALGNSSCQRIMDSIKDTPVDTMMIILPVNNSIEVIHYANKTGHNLLNKKETHFSLLGQPKSSRPEDFNLTNLILGITPPTTSTSKRIILYLQAICHRNISVVST